MKPTGENHSFVLPPALLAEVEAAADEEHRPAEDMVREAVTRYMEDREWNKVFTYGESRAKALGLTEKDVPRLIAESRQEKRQGRE